MNIKCDIVLDADFDNSYVYSGEEISGVLKYKVTIPTELEHIAISIKGDGKCSWTEKNKNLCRKTCSEEYVNVETIFQKKLKTIEPGLYERLFRFEIPKQVPSTFKDDKCKIVYRIEAVFSEAHDENDTDYTNTFTKEIMVRGGVTPTSPDPIILVLNKKPEIKVIAENTYVTPGKYIDLKLVPLKEGNTAPKSVKAKLVQYNIYKNFNTKSKIVQKKVLDNCVGRGENMKKEYGSELICTVPTKDNLFSVQYSNILEVRFVLKVTVKFPFPHKNSLVEIPVFLGEERQMAERIARLSLSSCNYANDGDDDIDDEADVDDDDAEYL